MAKLSTNSATASLLGGFFCGGRDGWLLNTRGICGRKDCETLSRKLNSDFISRVRQLQTRTESENYSLKSQNSTNESYSKDSP